jgi:ribosomal protein S18 acetylase RimI-like enzyme
MVSVRRASLQDVNAIVKIGLSAVYEAHKDSTTAENLQVYLDKNYTESAIADELNDTRNIYQIISYKGEPAGFSKIVLNTAHPNIGAENVTKLDRIYVLTEYHGLKLGLQLLNANIELCKKDNQAGIWLFTWIGNERAIDFYHKAGFKIIGSHQFYVTETHYNLNHQMYLDFRGYASQ